MNKPLYTYTMEFYPMIKRNELLKHTTWNDLTPIMLHGKNWKAYIPCYSIYIRFSKWQIYGTGEQVSGWRKGIKDSCYREVGSFYVVTEYSCTLLVAVVIWISPCNKLSRNYTRQNENNNACKNGYNPNKSSLTVL